MAEQKVKHRNLVKAGGWFSDTAMNHLMRITATLGLGTFSRP